ncbi:AEC family transporter [Paenalcaligenes sp. Me131]|uniref:AEC family transporter n=1 Tax=Paenalcaligenes sp. Me131 TaxID=3392636 RepID=UPI003D2905C8
MLVHTILEALGPITLGIAVGWGCGKTGFVKQDYSQAFADYVVKIALPLALFLAALSSSPKNILNIDYALALAVGLIVTYVLGYIAGRVMFKHNKADATMQALAVSFPDMAYCGPPVLIAAVGSAGLIAMVIGNLIYTVLILPLALALLGGGAGSSPLKALGKAVSQPLVILPILGAVLAVCGVRLPEILSASINELGKTAGGVALFFLGLFISKSKFSLNKEIIFNVFVKNIVQALLILGVGIALGLRGELLASAFLIGVIPTATAVPALAVGNKAYMDQSASTVVISTLCALISIPAGLAVVSTFYP